jgi:hypothetical protein
LSAPIDVGDNRLSTLAQHAEIPRRAHLFAEQKSARTRRAYGQDVVHFMRTLGIAHRRTRPSRPQGGDRLGALAAPGRSSPARSPGGGDQRRDDGRWGLDNELVHGYRRLWRR